jgi:hypothetical protein
VRAIQKTKTENNKALYPGVHPSKLSTFGGFRFRYRYMSTRTRGIVEFAETRPRGFSLALYSLLRIDTSFFGCGLLYVPYVPYGV